MRVQCARGDLLGRLEFNADHDWIDAQTVETHDRMWSDVKHTVITLCNHVL